MCVCFQVRPRFFNANGYTRNPRRASLEEMKEVQLEQLEKFRQMAAAGRWDEIHQWHFDWCEYRGGRCQATHRHNLIATEMVSSYLSLQYGA